MSGRRWTTDEDVIVRADYGRGHVPAIADRLGRTIASVFQRAMLLGLTSRNRGIRCERFRLSALALHDKGFATRVIAVRLRCCTQTVRKVLKDAGRRSHDKRSPQFRRGVAKRMKSLLAAGHPIHARWREGAVSLQYGLPPMSETALRVVLSLTNGPLSRRQICDAVGLPWKGSRRSLKTKNRGSHLANLAAAGLVAGVNQSGGGRGSGKGRPPRLYLLTAYAMDLIARSKA